MEYEIKPKNKFDLGLQELWRYRELLFMFAQRDVKVKYKQTYLGIAWALLQPTLMTVLFTLGLGSLVSERGNITLPYPAFALSGFVLWNLFSAGLSNSGNSMVSNAAIIKKIYFPRLIIPVSSFLVAFVDFIIAFIIMIPIMIWFNAGLNMNSILFIPLSLFLTFISSFGLGTFLSAANIKYRDVRYILPFFIQALFFATPVIYPISITGENWFSHLLMFNPMYAPIELFRCSFGEQTMNIHTIYYSLAVGLILFFGGIYYFRKTEVYFADIA